MTKYDNNTLLVFYTNTCVKCKRLDDELEKIKDKVKLIKINAEKERNLAKEFGVMSVPQLLYFKNNEYISKNGYMTSDEILEWIK